MCCIWKIIENLLAYTLKWTRLSDWVLLNNIDKGLQHPYNPNVAPSDGGGIVRMMDHKY